MDPPDANLGGNPPRNDNPPNLPAVRLRLYIARSTPNSVRAERNLSTALNGIKNRRCRAELEVIDVFAQPKRAITDGIVVTPTLMGLGLGKKIVLMGDLSDGTRLDRVLQDLLGCDDDLTI